MKIAGLAIYHHSFYTLLGAKWAPAMCRPQTLADQIDRTTNMPNADDKIPAAVAKELRSLAHDLSNSLETIAQATYLIFRADPPESSRRWVGMIDEASQEAVKINARLRELLRSHS